MTHFLGDRLPWLCALAVVVCAVQCRAQTNAHDRAFPQSKAAIEKALQEMPTGGRLPVLDGFATSTDHALDRYRRGYYQSKFQVTALPSGGSIVHVSVQVTAWYNDPVGSKSGYQLLPSNGRLESDLLDQLAEQLAGSEPASNPASISSTAATAKAQADSAAPESAPAKEAPISAPMPRLPEVKGYSSSLAQSLAEQEKNRPQAGAGAGAGTKKNDIDNSGGGPLETEAKSLEEILKNQAHPTNLVAVKKSGTPVVASASLNAKTLFLASAQDEFEMLDFNRDWVHVRISGLSRGWIWRNNLEMPDSVPVNDIPPSASPAPTAAEMFHVSREEVAQFPGDWQPLRGKNVKIVSVEKTNENSKDAGPQLRLEFTKSLLEKNYAELAQKRQELAGIVLIFDSADGGMIAATIATLEQWQAGTLSDAALWHQCFFDPPEISASPGSGGE